MSVRAAEIIFGGTAAFQVSAARCNIRMLALPLKNFLIISGIVIAAVGLLLLVASRQTAPLLVRHERQTLTDVFPLVSRMILERPDRQNRFADLKRLSDVDVTLTTLSGTVEETTLDGVGRGAAFKVGDGDAAVFELVNIGGKSAFALSSPLRLQGRDFRLVISKPDELLGPFFDELFTAAFFAAALGLFFSAMLAFLISHREDPQIRAISEAFGAMASGNYRFRLGENARGVVSGARQAINQAMERLEKTVAPAGAVLRPADVNSPETESQNRAFEVALSSVAEGVFIIDHLGRISAFNAKMEELSGFGRGSVIGKALSDIVTLTDRARAGQFAGLITRILATGTPEAFPAGTFLKRSDGTYVPVRVKTIPIKNDLRSTATHVVVLIEKIPGTAAAEEEKKETPAVSRLPKTEPETAPSPTLKPESAKVADTLQRPKEVGPLEAKTSVVSVLSPARPVEVPVSPKPTSQPFPPLPPLPPPLKLPRLSVPPSPPSISSAPHSEREPLPAVVREFLPAKIEPNRPVSPFVIQASSNQAAAAPEASFREAELKSAPPALSQSPVVARETAAPPVEPALPKVSKVPEEKSQTERVLRENREGSLEVLRRQEDDLLKKEIKKEIAEQARQDFPEEDLSGQAKREAAPPHNLPI